MKRFVVFSMLTVMVGMATTLTHCAKKNDGYDYDDLADTDSIPGSVKYIDTLPPGTALVHPGGLHITEDFNRIKSRIAANAEPWISGWNKLIANSHAQLTYSPGAVIKLVRGGSSREEPDADNYSKAFNDVAAAYQTAIRWKITGDATYAEKSIQILNAWAATCKKMSGSSDIFLAAGIYGFQFAATGELMRDYAGWKAEDFKAYQQWMLTLFYPLNHSFLVSHNGTCTYHYWANWDLCNIASVMAIGILTDKRSLYNEAVNYFQHGGGNGNIRNTINYVYKEDGLAQLQESGRDQGHATLDIALLAPICEMAYHQGDDFYSFGDNLLLKATEYTAKYNVANQAVPFTTYKLVDCDTTTIQDVISDDSRGNVRPMYAIVYNHYAKRKGLTAPYSLLGVNSTLPEGGGGDYGTTSGGFDQLGFGTLMYTRP